MKTNYLLALLLAIGCVSPLFAQFEPARVIQAPYLAPITSGDINQDGVPDLFSYQNNFATALIQTEPGLFYPVFYEGSSFEEDGIVFKKLEDLDGDGDLDYISMLEGDDDSAYIVWYENLDGNGQFGPETIIELAYAIPRKVYFVDINQDGLKDFVYLKNNFLRIGVSLRTDSGSTPAFDAQGLDLLDDTINFYVEEDGFWIEDLDLDGQPECVFVAGLEDDLPLITPLLYVAEIPSNFPAELGEPVQVIPSDLSGPSNGPWYGLEDLTGDGHPDFLLKWFDQSIQVFPGTGGVDFEDVSTVAPTLPEAGSMADLNNDGLQDLYVTPFTDPSNFKFYLNQGNLDFTLIEIEDLNMPFDPASEVFESILPPDLFPGSTFAFLLAPNNGFTGQVYPTASFISMDEELVLSRQDNLFPSLYHEVIPTSHIAAYDIGNDNDMDLLLLRDTQIILNEWIIGPEHSYYRPQVCDIVFSPEVDHINYSVVTSTDFDEDGDLDFIYHQDISATTDKIILIENQLNDQNRFFVQLLVDDANNYPDINHLLVADLNGDGQKDILSFIDYLSGSEGEIRLYLQQGGGGFADGLTISNQNKLELFRLFDFDQDGDKDIVAIREIGPVARLLVYYYEGNDTWSETVFGLLPPSNSGLEVCDMDNDGYQELILFQINELEQEARILHFPDQNGSPMAGLADTAYHYQGIGLPNLMTVYDADFDGYEDVLILDQSNTASYFRNPLGTGLDTSIPFGNLDTQLPESEYFLREDFDGDGFPDLLFKTPYSENALFLLHAASDQSILSGRFYMDENQNGIFDPGELPLQNMVAQLDPDNLFTYTNQDGYFSFSVEPSDYELSPVIPAGWHLTSSNTSYLILDQSGYQTELDFGLFPDETIYDTEIQFNEPFAFCNQNRIIWIDIFNTGTGLLTEGVLNVQLNPEISFVDANPAPATVNGSNISWDLESIPNTQNERVKLVVQYPSGMLLGEVMDIGMDVHFYMQGDLLAADSAGTAGILLCSYDPNDKLVYPDRGGPLHPILYSDTLNYTIRFQNTGNYPAQDIYITDYIDPNLDPATLRIISSSHPMQTLFDEDEDLLTFGFPGINLIDSVANEPESHGYVKFSIQPKQDAPVGSLISNTADIFFDANDPITTNTVINTLFDVLPLDSCEIELSILPADPDNIFCPGQIISLNAAEGYDSYNWYSNFTNSNIGGTLIGSTTAASYPINVSDWGFSYFYVEATNDSCIALSDPVIMDSWVFLFPVIQSSGQSDYCTGDSTEISYPSGGAASYQWFRDGQPIPGANEQSYWVKETGTYTLTVSYIECPDFYQSSGVGPSFTFFDPVVPEIEFVDGFLSLVNFSGTLVQWYVDGVPIEGANDPTYVPEFPGGDYTAEVIDANDCHSFTDPFFVAFVDGTSDHADHPEVILFPNPNNGSFSIQSSEVIQNCWVYDQLGRRVYTSHSNAGTYLEISLPDQAAGSYWVQLLFREGRSLLIPMTLFD